MSFWNTKAFRISAIVVAALLTIFLIIGSIGYSKAGKFIKEFEEDFKRISETDQFKTRITKLKQTNSVLLMMHEVFKFIWILDINKNDKTREKFIEAIKTKDSFKIFECLAELDRNKVVEAMDLSCLLAFDPEKISKLKPKFGFFATIGFLFRKRHPMKDIYKISEKIGIKLKDCEKSALILILFLDILDDKKIEISEFDYDKIKHNFDFSSDTFILNPLKRNDKTYISADFIIYLAEKAATDSEAIIEELKQNLILAIKENMPK
ncbi:hypothetical protein CWI38_0803p0020 [Hamiltosporidium tvaerminnensis]|uniref:Uncharacterized protein n=1 Tax=Hamiltosporidium tvaerminnensis TaxID=1176355 RepID=A0A4Q9LUR7_9MICR|nr:hypothetical protein CWI38_0803p0020 [Hamiltosporidium tvaerminnensis]